jgi:hypothetical protein
MGGNDNVLSYVTGSVLFLSPQFVRQPSNTRMEWVKKE